MSCGRYAEDFDIPVRAPKCPPPRMMFSQGHVSVRKLVQSYDVDVQTCGTCLVTCGTCFVHFGSLLVRSAHLVPLARVDIQMSISKCKYCFQAICFSHVFQVVYIEIWRNCARLLVRIVVDCGWKTRLCRLFSPAASSSNVLLIPDFI